MKKLGVIILNWNGLKLLQELIPTASRTTIGPEADLIVADNGSSDDSVEWLRQHHPEVKLIVLDRNYGFAEGYNRAIAMADYEYVTLLNSDVELTDGWWQPLLKFLETHSHAGAVQPKIMDYYHRDRFEYAGAAGGAIDKFGYPYCRGRLFDAVEQDDGRYDSVAKVAWASGACIMMPRAIYLRLGGLDPLFFAHMEEIDLCCRIAGAGYEVFAIPDAKVYHMGGASLNQGNPKKTYLNFRNNLLLIHKNMTRKGGRPLLLKRRLADTLAWAMYIAKLDFKNAAAVLKAHRDFRKMRKNYTDFPPEDVLPKLPGAKHRAVLARYLCRKKSLPLD